MVRCLVELALFERLFYFGDEMNNKQIEVGRDNLQAVREFMLSHLCATQQECAKALGLSVMAVNRHVKTIRSEWK